MHLAWTKGGLIKKICRPKSVGGFRYVLVVMYIQIDVSLYNYYRMKASHINPLLHRYSFQLFNNIKLLKTLWEKKKLLVTSNFFFSHNLFYSIRKLYAHLSIFLTSHLYLLLNWKSQTICI